jgi:hypothetical protein
MPFSYNPLLGVGLDKSIPLDGAGKIPSTYLPSYVDDVEEYSNLAAFPATGETGKIYVAIDTGFAYRWSGSVYVQIGITAAAGATTQVQFNDAGAFGGDSGLTFNKTTDALSAGGFIPTSSTVPANGVYLPAANSVGVATNGTGRLFVDADGNINLGQASSALQSAGTGLTVYGASSSEIKFLNSTTGALSTDGTALVATSNDFIINNREAGFIALRTSNTERLRITDAGLVGIGSSAPQAKLHISDLTASAVELMRLQVNLNSPSGNKSITWADSTDVVGRISVDYTAPTVKMRFGSLYNSGYQTSDLMTLTPTGLGIGSTSPNAPLDVLGGPTTAWFRKATVPAGIAIGTNTTATALLEGNIGGGFIFYSGTGTIASPSWSEAVRIDSSKRLLVGTSTARGNFLNSTSAPRVQIEGTSTDGGSLALITSFSSATNGAAPILQLGRAGSTAIGSDTIVANNNYLGQIIFSGNDGSEFVSAASIDCQVDGTPSANDLPGRLVFSTTADGAASPTERMRITSAGYFKASNDGTYQSGSRHEFRQTASAEFTVLETATDASYASSVHTQSVTRAANSAYTFFLAHSGGFSDIEFLLRGDGEAFADGSWTGGGADYAEYFEWSDSNPDSEDRRGISVVLDGDKIREAQAGEDPIGVISGNPSVVGDSAWNKWSGKYVRDEFGSYLLDEDGDRQLNPDYSPDQEYIPREQRPEWDCVGLMGKLRIRKGQVTGSRWIKMRDINDSVEEWLVR